MFARKLVSSILISPRIFSSEFPVIHFGVKCYLVLLCNERCCDGCLDFKKLIKRLLRITPENVH